MHSVSYSIASCLHTVKKLSWGSSFLIGEKYIRRTSWMLFGISCAIVDIPALLQLTGLSVMGGVSFPVAAHSAHDRTTRLKREGEDRRCRRLRSNCQPRYALEVLSAIGRDSDHPSSCSVCRENLRLLVRTFGTGWNQVSKSAVREIRGRSPSELTG
ncbi:hypothetical protein BDM02DRAFT_2448872 [Thelephora ganbajun]|uniref:Uncharacterized protein n=1 Tax=Thelephora ganbajun TaxID=370292 RepID=A0ACB6ZEZ1_THEGA|nr:hypothetical protein BDM02DRAFT_2448872 [Thelephora ganbajun]